MGGEGVQNGLVLQQEVFWSKSHKGLHLPHTTGHSAPDTPRGAAEDAPENQDPQRGGESSGRGDLPPANALIPVPRLTCSALPAVPSKSPGCRQCTGARLRRGETAPPPGSGSGDCSQKPFSCWRAKAQACGRCRRRAHRIQALCAAPAPSGRLPSLGGLAGKPTLGFIRAQRQPGVPGLRGSPCEL